MASLLASRGVFVARSAAPRPVAALRPSLATRALVTRPSQSFGGSFAGSSLVRAPPSRGALVVVANAKKSMACTKGGTNRKRRRSSGFRTRLATRTGRAILKARRKKGRHVIAPASERKSGGKK